jgi:hypothetical protein
MNPPRALGWLLALLGLLFAPASAARVFTGIGFGDGADPADPRRMDIHMPAQPGPHPIVVLAGMAEATTLARALADRGHVVAVIAPGQGSPADELARALAWLYWRGGSYGADPARLHLVAHGAAAEAALALGIDRRALTGARVPEGTLHALAVVGWRGRLPRTASDAAGVPPALLVLPVDASALEASGRLAEQWRAFGAAADVVEPLPAIGVTEGTLEVLERWLATAALQRVPRFESLRWSDDPIPQSAQPMIGVFADGGHLLAVGGGERPTVWRRESPQMRWQLELEAGVARVLWHGPVELSAGAATAGLLLAADDRLWLLARAGGDTRWSTRLDLGRVPPTARAAWVASFAVAGDGRALQMIAIDAGLESRVVLRQPDGRLVVEAPGVDERITGLAVLSGQAYLAAIGPRGGRVLRRVGERAGGWVTAAAWPAARGALAGLAPLAPDTPALLGMLADGTMLRVDPRRGELVVEADLRAAFERPWGALSLDALALSGTGWVDRVHPVSGDRVWLAGITVRSDDPSARAGWYLVRQASGHYAYGRASTPAGGDGAPLRALVGSPFVADGGAVVYALADETPPRLLRGAIPEPRQPEGFWADRAHADRGLVLGRTRAGWIALLFRREADGLPRWYASGGRIVDDEWQGTTALVRHRRAESTGALYADDAGRIAIRFGVDGADPACAGVDRHGAWALAVLEIEIGGEVVRDCIEPQRRADASRPLIDPTGLWMAPDGRWGLALQSLGPGSEGDEQALVFHFDADGLPRWAFARGARRDGRAALVLQTPDAPQAGTLAYAFEGACGRVAGSARLELAARGPGVERASGDTALLRAAGGGCY